MVSTQLTSTMTTEKDAVFSSVHTHLTLGLEEGREAREEGREGGREEEEEGGREWKRGNRGKGVVSKMRIQDQNEIYHSDYD